MHGEDLTPGNRTRFVSVTCGNQHYSLYIDSLLWFLHVWVISVLCLTLNNCTRYSWLQDFQNRFFLQPKLASNLFYTHLYTIISIQYLIVHIVPDDFSRHCMVKVFLGLTRGNRTDLFAGYLKQSHIIYKLIIVPLCKVIWIHKSFSACQYKQFIIYGTAVIVCI
jgi:hypothetical protein